MQKRCIINLLAFSLLWPITKAELSKNIVKDGTCENWNQNRPGSSAWNYLAVRNKDWKFSKDENGNILTPQIHSQLLAKTGVLKPEKKDVHSGKLALRAKGSFYLAPQKSREADYKTSDGTEYIVNFWVKGNGAAKVYMHVYGEDKPHAKIVSCEGKPQKDKWTQIKEVIKVYGKGAKSIYPRISLSEEMLVDDIFIGKHLKDDETQLIEIDPEYDERIAFAAKRKGAIIIDGNPNDKAWEKAIAFGGFRSYYAQSFMVSNQTRFKILFDDKNLYFLFEADLPDATSVLSEISGKPHKNKDGSLKDKSKDAYTARHSIELFLQAPGTSRYCQFVASLDGYKHDGAGKDWNGKWEFATSAVQDKWYLEMRIPAEDFKLESIEDMKEWRLNVTRSKESNYSTWAAVGGAFHNPYSFGRMITSPYAEWEKQAEAGIEYREKSIQREATAIGLSFKARLELINAFKKSTKAESAKSQLNWQETTKSYSQVAFLEKACKSMESIIKFKTYFKEKGRK